MRDRAESLTIVEWGVSSSIAGSVIILLPGQRCLSFRVVSTVFANRTGELVKRALNRIFLGAGVVGLAAASFSAAVPARSQAQVMRASAGSVDSAPMGLPAPTPYDGFGSSVVLQDDIALVTAPWANKMIGGVYVYTRSGSSYKRQAFISEPNGHSGDGFGSSVALPSGGSSPTTLAIGAPDSAKVGAVYIYVRSGSTWRRQATLINPVKDGWFGYGTSVALEGDSLLVGNINAGSNSQEGAVYSYVRSGSTWHLKQAIADPLNRADDSFGASISISGNTAVIGAYDETHSPWQGGAYIYTESGGIWRRVRNLSNPGSSDNGFGNAVALQGTTAVVGAFGQGGRGAIYIYTKDGGSWPRQATFVDPRPKLPVNWDMFGFSVSVWKNRIIAGAPINYGGKPSANKCPRVYEYTNSSYRWKMRSVIVSPICETGDGFAGSVAVWGNAALVGDPSGNNNVGTVYTLTLP